MSTLYHICVQPKSDRILFVPRPTVRRWCEHGYNAAFQKTVSDLKDHFRVAAEPEVVVSAKEPETQQGSISDAQLATTDAAPSTGITNI